MRSKLCGLTLLALVSPVASWAARQTLDFERRVEAQRAIERVYYAHQIGATKPFEEGVPREVLEKKVRTYLKQSVALETMWKTRVTAEMLEAELARIARDTWMPERLEEIYRALDYDPVLVLECFARPVLVNRLARSFFASDERPHAGVGADGRFGAEGLRPKAVTPRPPERSWDSWWTEASQALNESFVGTVAIPGAESLPAPSCPADDTWDNGSLGQPPTGQVAPLAVWTGTHMLSWDGIGLKYDPLIDTWTQMSAVNAPTPRARSTVVWTGRVMIVWGGDISGAQFLNTGGRYDPALDTWTATTLVDAPAGRMYHTAIWTGSEMIVWGGYGNPGAYLNSGGRYNPASDTWTPTPNVSAPESRWQHSAVWTGREMIVWGGEGLNGFTLHGGRYDAATDSWRPVSVAGAPQARFLHSAVWTGSLMVVWGGFGQYDARSDGGRYDPVSDSWTPMTNVNAPYPRYNHPVIWTGSLMIVWGGTGGGGGVPESDGRYDPVSDTWTPTSTLNAPSPRRQNALVWTGSHMLVWGGCSIQCSTILYAGGRYDPAADSWTPISTTSNGPAPVSQHSAVWTGSQMIVWGGWVGVGGQTATGSRYDPVTDDWTQTSMVGAPEGRGGHTAVWTGDEMLIWGGGPGFPFTGLPLERGGRYDPLTDTWRPMPTAGAPDARFLHGAVWTGREMIVWGGFNGPADLQSGTPINTGGRYDPALDLWRPTSITGAPSPRFPAPAVWTGSEMIVWGGDNGAGVGLGDGARYDPVSDIWRVVTTLNAPSARRNHASLWIGNRMLVWGGRFTGNSTAVNTGALYDPRADTWSPTTIVGAPSSRAFPKAVWTGRLAVIWGGSGNRTGGRYDLVTDTWTPTSTDGAPFAAGSAIWTGLHMILWGDSRGGGRYVVFQSPDDDGDGVTVCAGDCDDANIAAWSTPGEVPDLTLRADGVTLDWAPPAAAGGASVTYDTLRSASGSDFTGAATCVESDDGSDTMAADGASPQPGEVFFYLVRAENDCPGSLGLGPLGAASDGTSRTGRTCP